MREIQRLIDTVERYKYTIIHKQFNSKKNTVAYVALNGKTCVLKWYMPEFSSRLETEYSVLKNGSSALNVPFPIEKDAENNVLIMKYITGKNLCDLINDVNISVTEKNKVIVMLADWFARFHIYFKEKNNFHVRGDSILRNFILSESDIYGVDFEEFRVGKPVEDVTGLCSSILASGQLFATEKFKFCNKFIETYKGSVEWSLDDIDSKIADALIEKISWRPEDKETLKEHALKIREQGLG